MTKELKCKTCKPPERHPGCHSVCKYFLEWKQEQEEKKKKRRKDIYISNIGYYNKKKK